MSTQIMPHVVQSYDRGDIAAADITDAFFNEVIGTWPLGDYKDLNLSAIIPRSTRRVLLRVILQCATVGFLNFRQNGNVNVVNIADANLFVAGVPTATQVWVYTGGQQVIEVLRSQVGWAQADVAVLAWEF